MSIFPFRDSWEVWRQKVNEAIGSTEPIPASNVTFNNSGTEVTATNVQAAIAEVAGDVASIAEVVGDENSGLVKDVDGLIRNEFENGVVNLLPAPYTSVDATVHGITRRYNSDGSVTFSGTATSGTSYEFKSRISDNFALPAGKYKIKCFVDGTYSGDIKQQIKKTEDGSGVDIVDSDIGNETEFTIESATGALTVQVIFGSGTAITDSITVYPMIYRSELSADKYYPYAMSNRELTISVDGLQQTEIHTLPFADNTKLQGTLTYIKIGRVVIITSDVKMLANASFTLNDVIASNLPQPIQSNNIASTLFAGILNITNNIPITVKITDNGDMNIQQYTNGAADVYGRISLAYFAKD